MKHLKQMWKAFLDRYFPPKYWIIRSGYHYALQGYWIHFSHWEMSEVDIYGTYNIAVDSFDTLEAALEQLEALNKEDFPTKN